MIFFKTNIIRRELEKLLLIFIQRFEIWIENFKLKEIK